MSRVFPISIWQTNAADHAVMLGVTDSPTKRWLGISKMFGPTERSSGLSSAVLILGRRSSLRSFIGWQTSCGGSVVPVRSKRASLRSRANLRSVAGRTRHAGPVNRRRSQSPLGSVATARSLARTDQTSRRPTTLSTSMRPPLEPYSKARAIAECFLRLSDLDPTLLDRVGRYEGRLWRQAAQTIWTLEAMRRPQLAPTPRAFRKPAARLFWDSER